MKVSLQHKLIFIERDEKRASWCFVGLVGSGVGLIVNDYGTLLVRGLALMALTHEGDYCIYYNTIV